MLLIQRPLTGNYANNFGEGLEIANADEPCSGKRCIANEHCCPGQVCIDVDGGLFFSLFLILFFRSSFIITNKVS